MHTNNFQTYQALKGMARNLMKVPLITIQMDYGFIVPQELIDILCVEPGETSEVEEEGEEDLATDVDNIIDVVYEDESD